MTSPSWHRRPKLQNQRHLPLHPRLVPTALKWAMTNGFSPSDGLARKLESFGSRRVRNFYEKLCWGSRTRMSQRTWLFWSQLVCRSRRKWLPGSTWAEKRKFCLSRNFLMLACQRWEGEKFLFWIMRNKETSPLAPQTYCVDFQVPDTACTSTAFLSGIKTNFGVLSMSANVALRNCSNEHDANEHVDSIFKFAQQAGKATGIVTNSRLTHPSVAGEYWIYSDFIWWNPLQPAAYAKSASRYWESDVDTPRECMDIAKQMIYGDTGKNFDVLLGGGYREFLPRSLKDPHGRTGKRADQRDLIREWMFLQVYSTLFTRQPHRQWFNVIYSQDRAMFVHDRASKTLTEHNVLK